MPHEGKQLTQLAEARATPDSVTSERAGALQRSAQRAVLHDGRSALHAIVGHVELLDQGLLGDLSHEQRAALRHVRGSALWLFELLESSLELAHAAGDAELGSAPLCLAQLLRHEVSTLQRDRPSLDLTLDGPPVGERLMVSVPAETLRQLLTMQLDVVAEAHGQDLHLSLSATDLHVSWLLRAQRNEGSYAQRRRSLPPSALGETLERSTLRNALRLKRCEAVVARNRGRLLVADDLSSIRLVLPL